MKKIITISREFGSYGGTIGQLVAKKLGFEYYDKALITQAAQNANLELKDVAKFDEKKPVVLGFAQSLFNAYNSPVEERVFEAQKKVIKQLAESKNCVIVGRNANNVLSQFDETLHVFIHAPEKNRLQNLKLDKMKNSSDEEILKCIHNVDKAREKFCLYFTKNEFGNAKCYDLTLDSSVFGIEKCVELIVAAAK